MPARNSCAKRRYAIDQCALYKVRGIGQLATRLFSTPASLKDFADRHESLYREWDHEVRPGKVRRIENPTPPLKRLQARIAELLMRLEPPDFLFCPVKKRDFIQNAIRHAGARSVWRIDVKEYFPSTRSKRVYEFFRYRLKCAPDIASILTKLTTFRGYLPTGSPASPILAYYANEQMWLNINAEALAAYTKPSLYMDDLSVSGSNVPWALRHSILRMLKMHGFIGHKEALSVARPATVTGIITGDSPIGLPHKHYKKARDATKFDSLDETQRRARSEGFVRLRQLVARRARQANVRRRI